VSDPLQRLAEWYEEAVAAGVQEPNAMALATATPDGAPSVRIVLLKGIDERGAQFFTNYESRKGRELEANPRAALVFYWRPLGRQVRVEGTVRRLSAEESDAYWATRAPATLYWQPLHRAARLEGAVERLTPAESDAYFGSRPRGSRLGARASKQGTPLGAYGDLEAAFKAESARFPGEDVPRPEYWGGFRLVPVAIELWQGMPSRLHDRVHWVRDGVGSPWREGRLSP
jgi:pyridoxamine 5'-phosphate oxidase